ncbi:hypothetical protein [Kitasatospora sp. NPDC004289]
MLRELREKDGTAAAARHDGPSRHARHGRPKPVGARFRLPGFRFSGAAMAMSTVVGISVATTWLVSEQQSVGRLPGVTNVGASPPVPSPDSAPEPSREGTPSPTPSPSATVPGPRALGARTPSVTHPASPSPVRPRTSSPTPAAPTTATSPATPAPGPSLPAPPVPSSSPSPSPGGGAPGPVGPVPVAPTPSPKPTEAMTGLAERTPLGQTGSRHTLTLAVGEDLTALQVEFQLARPESLPGTLPWTTLPGAVVTVLQERGTLVYRFTLPPGLDVAPGSYLFAVHTVDPSASASPGPARPATETWSASAFNLRRSTATTTRGTFG